MLLLLLLLNTNLKVYVSSSKNAVRRYAIRLKQQRSNENVYLTYPQCVAPYSFNKLATRSNTINTHECIFNYSRVCIKRKCIR